ncbi:hypothetical protein [Actinomyces bowdenii]|uniref:Uncharacterized protein n=1 Tax=Actinomyces bowdenii TaxID=131109 RepID=A0A853EJ83_9ACTO|nr:hypothetical protein [Actinomyces bowdenii]MBF0696099.1 hypothetical protein [Actinomyces bowdenii]NYS68272.1 hypothetical protein [Actinomyces bowdenii]
MSKTITLQPDYLGDVLPYPFFIDAGSGLVGRQDFWGGSPYRLVGMAWQDAPFEVVLTMGELAEDPHAAVGLVPVFEDAVGGYSTWTQMVIDSVTVKDDVARVGGEAA